jgi:hypothetical protein
VAFLAVVVLFTVIRLHFIFALSRYYGHLVRNHDPALRASAHDIQMERIYLLPDRYSMAASNKDTLRSSDAFTDAPLYAPVPLAHVSPQLADELRASATEAWVSRARQPRSTSLPAHCVGNNADAVLYPTNQQALPIGSAQQSGEKL